LYQSAFKLEVLTPIFVGGANQKEIGNLRKAIKAGMAFWWRAIQQFDKVEDLKKSEVHIFGGMESKLDENGKQIQTEITAKCRIDTDDYSSEIKNQKDYPIHTESEEDFISKEKSLVQLAKYSGYGKVGEGVEYIPSGSSFSLCLSNENGSDKIAYKQYQQSLIDLCLFGGIGGRQRNSWGKFILENLNSANLIERFKKLQVGELKNYPAFSKDAILFQTKECWDTPIKTVIEIARIYRRARVGCNLTTNKLKGVDSKSDDQNNDDFTGRHLGEKRQYLAHPLQIKNRMDTPAAINVERLPKSIHFNVMPCAEEKEKYRGYALYLPYKAFTNATHQAKYIAAYIKLIELLTDYGFKDIK